MLTDDFLYSLPDDPELAFIELVTHLDEWLTDRPPPRLDERPDYIWERKYADTLRGQMAVEIEPQSAPIRFTRRVPHRHPIRSPGNC
jgi:hypothetical protein